MPATRPILLVEDDHALRQVLAEQLIAGGFFDIVEAASLAEAERYLDVIKVRFDAIILDINLPDGDGRDFCAKIRQQGHVMPVIMLTGIMEETDVINSLNAGANDYVTKPFRINELLARLQTQLRLYDLSDNAVFTIGPYIFRPGAKLLTDANKKRIRLTNKEVKILRFLYLHANQAVPRRILMNEVWGYNVKVTTHTLETHIYRLRQKIKNDSVNCYMLITSSGSYQLTQPRSDQNRSV